MTVLSGANEIMQAVSECARRTRDLRERMESDFSLWRLDPFQLGKTQGDYSDVTSNAPAVLANRVIEILSDARLRFVIPLADEDEAARARLALTERFVQGALNLADQRLAGMVAPSVQQQLAWYTTLRGWYAVRVYLREDAAGCVVPDIAVWDVLNTYWGMGASGLAWACYRRYASAEQLRAEYGLETVPDEYGRVPVYDYWDDENEAVIVGGDFVLSPTPHGLGRIPVLIGAAGAAPLVQSARYSDTLRNVGESVYANNRQLYPRQSEVLTYYLTITALGARTPLVVYYIGDTPPEFENNPYAKGNVIFLKKDKEEARELLKADLPHDARLLLDFLSGQVSLGGLPPVAYGEMDQQLPASGMHITPWFDAAAAAHDKLALRLRLFCRDTTVPETVTVKYRLDHAATDRDTGWLELGVVDSTGDNVFTFGGGTGQAFKSVQFRFDLARTAGDSSKSPEIIAFALAYLKLVDLNWAWSFEVDCADGYGGLTARELETALLAAARRPELLGFTFRSATGGSETHNVKIHPLRGEVPTGDHHGGRYQLTVIEP